jgi:hypothetical protein
MGYVYLVSPTRICAVDDAPAMADWHGLVGTEGTARMRHPMVAGRLCHRLSGVSYAEGTPPGATGRSRPTLTPERRM